MIHLRKDSDIDTGPNGIRIKTDMNPQHAIADVSDRGDEHRIDDIDTLFAHLQNNPTGDRYSEDDAGEAPYGGPSLAQSIQDGGDW